MRTPRSPRRKIAHVCIGLTAALALAACGGGGSEDTASDSGGDGEAGDSAEVDVEGGDLVEMSGTIEVLVGDTVINYTISVPEGFVESEPTGGTSPKFEDPSDEFGERTTRIELVYLPSTSTAQDLIDDWLAVNSTITVFEQADEADLSWFTYRTPSSSDENKIAFGTANTSRPLPDGTALHCRALTQNGIGEEWSEADAKAIADANLEICRTLMPA